MMGAALSLFARFAPWYPSPWVTQLFRQEWSKMGMPHPAFNRLSPPSYAGKIRLSQTY